MSRVTTDRVEVARVFLRRVRSWKVPVPQVAEQFVARFVVPSLAPYEQISERICERMVEVPVPQVAEQLIGVTKSVGHS